MMTEKNYILLSIWIDCEEFLGKKKYAYTAKQEHQEKTILSSVTKSNRLVTQTQSNEMDDLRCVDSRIDHL